MKVKGILEICKGILSSNVLTFQDSEVTTPVSLSELLNSFPTAGITMFGGGTAPAGFLMCDGASYPTATYPELFAKIGYAYGGSGANFNVPNFKQRFPLGKADSGTGANMGDTGGSIDHVHSVDPPATNTSTDNGDSQTAGILGLFGSATPPNYQHNHSVNIPAFNSASSNPPFLVVRFIIKT